MSNTVRLTTPSKTARANLMITWCDSATLAIYSGTVPATADNAITDQVKLAEFTLPTTPSGTVTDGVFTLATGTAAATVLADGTPTFARLTDSGATDRGDYDVGAVGSDSAVEIDNTSLITGALVSLVSFVQTEG